MGGQPRLVLDLGCGPAPQLGGRAQDAGAWRLKEGRLLPAGTPGVCVCVCACVCVGGCVHICMHVCAHVLCVCMRVWSRLASREPPALGLSGCWWVEELVPLAGRHGMKTQRAHPCSGHPSPLQAGIRLEGTAGATETPSQGPPRRDSGAPGAQGSLGPARENCLTLRGSSSFSFVPWLLGGI